MTSPYVAALAAKLERVKALAEEMETSAQGALVRAERLLASNPRSADKKKNAAANERHATIVRRFAEQLRTILEDS